MNELHDFGPYLYDIWEILPSAMRDGVTSRKQQRGPLSEDRLRFSRLQPQRAPQELLLVGEQGPSVKLEVESCANANGSTEKPVKEVHWLDERHQGEGLDAVVDHVRRAEHVDVNWEGTEVDDRTVKDVGKDGVTLHHGDHHVHVGPLSYELLNPFWLDEVESHLLGCVLVVIVGPPPHTSRIAKSSK